MSSPSVPATAIGPARTATREEPGTAAPFESALSSATTLNVLVGVAIAVRVWAYAPGVSLWLDELLLTRNIVGLPLRDLLTKPLQLDQLAPRGFLLLEKLAVLAFGAPRYGTSL